MHCELFQKQVTIYNIALLLAANGALVASGSNAVMATLVKGVTLNLGCIVSSAISTVIYSRISVELEHTHSYTSMLSVSSACMLQ
jgi:drug/metabolite transporter (DMT)-like permease